MAPKRTTVRPPHPGVLVDRALSQMGKTQDALARALVVSRLTVNQLVGGRRKVTPEMALRLARVLNTTPEIWLNLQRAVDLYDARIRLGKTLQQLKVLR